MAAKDSSATTGGSIGSFNILLALTTATAGTITRLAYRMIDFPSKSVHTTLVQYQTW